MRILFYVFFCFSTLVNADSKKTTIHITDLKKPESLDPLKADNVNNMVLMRMLYLTPIEIDQQNNLYSPILDKFSYDEKQHKITFVVKSGIKFDDGQEIKPFDVYLAVKRVAFSYPELPVIKDIKGIKEFTSENSSMLGKLIGLKLQNQTITIDFEKQVIAPLFRFSLELFSIIPSNCIDLKSNSIKCNFPSPSGYYRTKTDNPFNEEIEFTRRVKTVAGRTIPEYLTFRLSKPGISPEEHLKLTLDQIDESSVAYTLNLHKNSQQIEKMNNNLMTISLPKSQYIYLSINASNGALKYNACRRLMANTFRTEFSKFRNERSTRSLFSKLLPGYLSDEEFPEVELKDIEFCKKEFTKTKIKHARVKSSIFYPVYISTFKSLGVHEVIDLSDEIKGSRLDAFSEGKIDVVIAGNGFWPHDPINDLIMLFTPRLHNILESSYSDPELRKLLDLLTTVNSGDERVKVLQKVNFYLYEQAFFNPFTHYGSMIVTKKGVLANFPAAIGSSYPWQMFKE